MTVSEPAEIEGSYLLVFRAGGVWGLPNGAVETVERGKADYRVGLRTPTEVGEIRDLVADEVLGVVHDMKVWPVAAVVRRYWPEAPGGLAVYGEVPIVVVDPRQPPRVLRSEEGESSDAEANND